MTEQYNEIRSGAHVVSRRTIAAGAAWAVPTVALATSTPAFAASQSVCGAVTWASGASGAISGSTDSVTVTYGNTGGYANAGSAYNYANGTLQGSNLVSGTYIQGGTTPSADGYHSTTLTFPASFAGPFYFTVSGIDSDTTTSEKGGTGSPTTFVDRVVVLHNGTTLAPVGSSNVNVTGGTVTAGTAAPGTVTYQVDNLSGSVEIRLSNAYSGTTGAHPNQSIQISALACGTYQAPPAPNCTPDVFSYSWSGINYGDTFSTNTNQQFSIGLDFINVTGLPPTAKITRIEDYYRIKQRDDANLAAGGVYDPGNSHANPNTTCNISYESVNGCSWTQLKSSTATVGGSSVRYGLFNDSAYKASGVKMAPWWDPANGATYEVSRAWQDYTFKNGTSGRMFELKFTTAPNLNGLPALTKDANGCMSLITKGGAPQLGESASDYEARIRGNWSSTTQAAGGAFVGILYSGVNAAALGTYEVAADHYTRVYYTYTDETGATRETYVERGPWAFNLKA